MLVFIGDLTMVVGAFVVAAINECVDSCLSLLPSKFFFSQSQSASSYGCGSRRCP